MVRITEDLIRRKSEHNELEISTLEELSLHQENIERIEHLQNWCKHLQILLLQSNLIPRIENLWKLKKLQYLNLALNNIECIEGLEGLESLQKLDLTLNFIGDLTSVKSLKSNIHLKVLILTGNPCTDYEGYRDFTVTVVPQLKELDSSEITRSERILAAQRFREISEDVERQQEEYKRKREEERMEEDAKQALDNSDAEMTPEEIDSFWNQSSKNTPEERVRIAKKAQKIKEQVSGTKKKTENKTVRLFSKEDRPLNINQAKIPFTLYDDDKSGCKILDLAVYKHLDSSLINVDLHPKYVTIIIKGQVFQITFDEEISPDKSKCQRSQTTGHLVITMAIVGVEPKKSVAALESRPTYCQGSKEINNEISRRELLEIGPALKKLDFTNICEDVGLVDSSEVPPLE